MQFIEIFNNFFFPANCICCDRAGVSICEDCFLTQCNINFVQKCHVCGGESKLGLVHSDCKDSSHLDGLIYLTNYNDLVKDLVRKGKYGGQFSIFKDLGIISAQYFKSFYGFKDFIVTSVPMHPSKKRRKGYNQAEILAKAFSNKTNKSYIELLKRNTKTKSQVGMGREEREVNLIGAFEANTLINLSNFDRVILIDDVYTTGATLNQCAKVLKEAGVREVIGFCFAKSRT